MNYNSVEVLEEIKELLDNGSWSTAIEEYKAINISANTFSEWMSEQDLEVITDFSLLGFYSRDYTPKEDGQYA